MGGERVQNIPEAAQARAVSRHSLSYILCSISEMLRAYDFDTMDLLIIHAILNTNVVNIMRDPDLDKRYAGLGDVEPDSEKRGVSRAALARFLNIPVETVRRRVASLIKKGVVEATREGLIITEKNQYKFGNNQDLQVTNVQLVKKLMRDLERAGLDLR
jgi:CRP-like cAMP-binding protein